MLVSDFLPSLDQLLTVVPIAIVITLLAILLVSVLKKKYEMRTAYTRKIFHFIIFTSAAILQYYLGLQATVIFGSVVSIAVLYSVFKGDGDYFYESLARPKDAPHRSKFIIIPLFSTALGGVVSNVFFPQTAFIGYLVGGWGDAIGEPVGSKWGKHPYNVPTLFGVPATRTLEGSLAVATVSFLVCIPAMLSFGIALYSVLLYALITAIVAMLVEAVSSHGTDNFTVQIAAAALSYYLLV